MNDISGGNGFLAGTLSLWLLSVVSYLCRGIPRAIFQFLKRNFTTSMTINNGGYAQEQTIYNFIKWLQPNMSTSMSRTLSVETDIAGDVYGDSASLGIGFGLHFVFREGRMFWIYKNKLESSGSNLEKYEITISTIGRSHDPFKSMVKEFMPKPDKDKNNIYRLCTSGDWVKYRMIPKRPMQSIAINKELRDSLLSQITHFKKNRQWFYARALAYKLTYILHGMPGTGKTSIIKSIASEFDMNLCIININYMSDMLLESAFSTVPDNSIIIIEDFDSSTVTTSRGIQYQNSSDESMENKAPRETSSEKSGFGLLSLTGLLNALDGVIPIDNCIVFMTTNDIGKVDPAIYRKGRVDHILEIGELGTEEIREYTEYLFPDYDFSEYTFHTTIGCNLHYALLTSKDNPEVYINNLIENGIVSKKRN